MQREQVAHYTGRQPGSRSRLFQSLERGKTRREDVIRGGIGVCRRARDDGVLMQCTGGRCLMHKNNDSMHILGSPTLIGGGLVHDEIYRVLCSRSPLS